MVISNELASLKVDIPVLQERHIEDCGSLGELKYTIFCEPKIEDYKEHEVGFAISTPAIPMVNPGNTNPRASSHG